MLAIALGAFFISGDAMTQAEPNGPSEHLSWSELACKDGTPYPPEWRADRAVKLARAFERIRELCGFALIVSSAYRTAVYNQRINGGIGGAVKSQHVEGRALDLHPAVTGLKALQKLRGAAEVARREGLIRGIGIYDNFVHVDTRPGKAATWSGSRTAAGNVITPTRRSLA